MTIDYAQFELNRKNLVSLRQIAEVSRSRYEVGKSNAAEPLAAEVEASKLLEAEQDILRNIDRNLVSWRQTAEVSRSRYEVGKSNAAEPLAAEVEASKLLESEQDILRN